MKLDLWILCATVIYYPLGQWNITPVAYPDGHSRGIWWFFTWQWLTQIVFQAFLMPCDLCQRKTCIISVRGGAFTFLVGMTLTLIGLGLLTPWLIGQFAISAGLHIYIFMNALEMENDEYLFMPTGVH